MASLASSVPLPAAAIDVVVTRRWLETPDIVVLELADCTGQRLPDYTAGAHIDLLLGAGLTRQYSLSRMPVAGGSAYEIAVLRDPQSRGGSVAVHALEAGARLAISAPRNHFPLAVGAHPSLLFGGGIGVTPMLAMAEALHGAGAAFEFHYCVRSRAAAAFLDRLAQAPYAHSVHVHCDDGDPAQSLNAAAVFAAAPRNAHAYVCGPGGFMAHVLDTGAAAGWPEAQLHAEFFKAPDDAGQAPGTGFSVQIASTGALIAVDQAESIAQALHRHGIAVEVSCEAGVCGACLTRVVAGTPDHRDYYLNPAEKAAGDQMMLCCSRALSPLLVLGL